MGHRIPLVVWAALAALLVGCDLATKWLAVHLLRGRPPLELYAWLDLRYVENHDVAFHLMWWIPASVRYGVILTVGLFTSSVLLVIFLVFARRHRGLGFGFVLILSGAAGNMLNRWHRGFVVDFIHVHIDNFSWPVFNVADICVSVGIVLVGVIALRTVHPVPVHLEYPPPPLPPHKPFLQPIAGSVPAITSVETSVRRETFPSSSS